ncbi:MAG TPA: hypothetical protein VGB98_00835 [Pyrinomonadaceae bacterium]|jgi:hypothetical protein
MKIQDRRAFLRTAAAAAAGLLVNGARTRAAPGLTPDAASDFEMLVLGDSVVWGQGLGEGDKFYTLVRRGLEEELLRRPVRQLVKAHSGATILPDRSPCVVASGEVNISTPTITYQIRLALDDYGSKGVAPESVGLILVNGGINDITVARLLNVFATDRGKVRELARRFCGDRMRGLLLEAVTRFPNAVVVVPGYFPIISAKTDPELIKRLIEAYLGIEDRRKSLEAIDAAGDTRAARGRSWILRRLAELSSEWYAASDENLQRAADEVNAKIAGRPELQLSAARRTANPLASRMAAAESRRVFFVRVPFTEDESYAAPSTHLWRITGRNPDFQGDPKVSRFITDDHQFEARQPQCFQPKLNAIALQSCQIAGTGHPNVLGARRYSESIMAKLREITSP